MKSQFIPLPPQKVKWYRPLFQPFFLTPPDFPEEDREEEEDEEDGLEEEALEPDPPDDLTEGALEREGEE